MAVSKRVIIPVRVPEDVAQAIDNARAGQSRSAWVADLIDAALTEAAPVKKTSDTKDRRSGCPHPRARVIKGFCYACGMPATI